MGSSKSFCSTIHSSKHIMFIIQTLKMAVNKSHIPPLILILIFQCMWSSSSTSGTRLTNITIDEYALLALKTRITLDPNGLLQNWTVATSVCNWIGVTCGERHDRVTALNISNMGLTGTIHPALGNLSFLVSIDISSNKFGRSLPQDLVRLRRLRFMRLDYNLFDGEVPSWFSLLPQLQLLSLKNNSFTSLNPFFLSFSNGSKLDTLDVSFNSLQGEISESIGNLGNLKVLRMQGNGFSGPTPRSITNMSNLETLHLSYNFLEGVMPESIGNLHNLRWLLMENNKLIGSIPLSIFNISTLERIGFTNNSLSGTLPDDMCVQLPLLQRLSLSFNKIGGQIPSNFSSCPQLQVLSLSSNSMIGTIPQDIGSLEMLELLYLGANNLTGTIPSEIGKLQSLQALGLERNSLSGSVPYAIFNLSFLQSLSLERNELSGFLADDIGNLTMLVELYLSDNNFTGPIPTGFNKLTELGVVQITLNSLSGPIPSSIFNSSTLTEISLTENQLSGNLPENICKFLPNLQQLYLGANTLEGVLPASISNCSLLETLTLAANKFSGPIPNSLGDLRFLQSLNLDNNNFTSASASSELSFITSLTSCRYLQVLSLTYTPLNGILPKSVGNFSSSLQDIRASGCKIKGSIPNEIGNLSGLTVLYLGENDLHGEIPSALGKLSNLQELYLRVNRLTGFVPNVLCGLKYLGAMVLNKNQLTGSIPDCLGNASSLRYVYLYSNHMTSSIPASIWSLHDILELDISSNSFSGSLSPQIGNLRAVAYINLSMNQFSNDIPNTLGGLQSMILFSLADNRFQGPIPDSIGKMLTLNSLDLSHNMLSGKIPKSFESLTDLEYFNVSFNELSGEIPTNGPFTNFTSKSFAFNMGLCGPPRFQVPPCKEPKHGSKRKKVLRATLIPVGIGTLLFAGIMVFLVIRYCRRKKSPTSDVFSMITTTRISYYELLQATNEFSEDNLLGRGSFGSVYKGMLEDGTILAVKVFNMFLEVATNTFDAECEVLRNLRHRNLIKVVSSCSNQDFKALLLEYMPNGSLDKWLYHDIYFLDIMQRMNIMIHVANALEYLHHGYSTPVVHCDLKPSNILLDENMVARVSDFGITKFLGEEQSITHTKTLATLGYMAPEYGLEGRVSTRCDVYSFGILLMETFTRKKPSDEIFSGDMTLKNWVKASLPINAVSQVIDANLIDPEEMNSNEKFCLVSSVMELALRCCEDSPGERMNMKDVVAELGKIKAKLMLHYPTTKEHQTEDK